MVLRSILLAAVAVAAFCAPPAFNDTKCPGFWEVRAPHLVVDFKIEELEGFYYELALHDWTQFPLCVTPPRCITANKTLGAHPDGVRFVHDAWNLECFGRPYPQTLLFNVTDEPAYLRGYVPDTVIPFLPRGVVSSVLFPDTIVDFKPGPEGWVVEFQCVEAMGGVRFVGVNYYSRTKTEQAYQEMDAAARAQGLGFFMDKGFGLRRVSHENCTLEPNARDSSTPVLM
mmetsp:Transcript_141260/g.393686  ORF Transcript_141260/g.393686 Transcript_141260/m.393686 type:complete len:228 (+) Transcript_141260:1-684(+)